MFFPENQMANSLFLNPSQTNKKTSQSNSSSSGCTCSKDLYQEISRFDNLSEIVKFKPVELLQRNYTKIRPTINSHVPSKPVFACLRQDKLLNQSEVDFSLLCKQGTKYANAFMLASHHLKTNNKNNGRLRRKVLVYLRNLKVCRSYNLIEGDLLPFTHHDVCAIRRSSLQVIKTISHGHWGKHLQEFNNYRTLKSFICSSLKGARLPLSAHKLNIKQFFAKEKLGTRIIDQLEKSHSLKSFNLNSENLGSMIHFQERLSKALKKHPMLKDLTLNCYHKQDLDDDNMLARFDTKAFFWVKMTELNLYNFWDDSIIDFLSRNIHVFQNLYSLNYAEIRSNPVKFSSFACLQHLSRLQKLSLSITLPDSVNEEVIGFELFRSLAFPPNIESISMIITGSRPKSILKKVSQSDCFFQTISKLDRLKSFAVNISTYTFIETTKQEELEIIASFNFFNKVLENLPKGLEELTLSLFQPILMSSATISYDMLLYTLAKNLKRLRSLTLNFLGINLSTQELEPPILPRLKTLTLYNLCLPFSFINNLETTCLQELNCWITRSAELENLVMFLKQVNYLTSLKVVQIQVTKLNYKKLTQALLLEMAKIFLNFKELEDFTLGLASVAVEREWAEWFMELCKCKQGLKFCNLKFQNYQIVKEYFAVSIRRY